MTEYDVATFYKPIGIPLSCHMMFSSGARAKLGLASPSSKTLNLGALLFNILANSSILYSVFTLSNLSLFLISSKFFLEGFVIFIGSRIFLTKISFLSYSIWNITQPIYIPIVGLAGLIGKFSWKE